MASPRRLGDLADACVSPRFSPDGGTVYFSRDDRGSECYDFYRCRLPGGQPENLLPDTPDLAPLPDFDLSPDGTRIAMTVAHDDGYSVAVMPAAPCPGGEGIVHLVQHPYTETSPRWSPDGDHLAVAVGTRGQDTAIHVMAADGGDDRVVGGADDFHAGHLCVVARRPPSGLLRRLRGPPGHRHLRRRERRRELGLERARSTPTGPAWSPDGRRLAFLVDCEAETGLCLLDLATAGCTS